MKNFILAISIVSMFVASCSSNTTPEATTPVCDSTACDTTACNESVDSTVAVSVVQDSVQH
jgi:hypothetical protein